MDLRLSSLFVGQLRTLALCLALFIPHSVLATTWYVDAASVKGDGSQSTPWSDIGAALASGKVHGGDTILLAEGAYPAAIFRKVRFEDQPLRIISDPAAPAHFPAIVMDQAVGISIEGIAVWTLPGDKPYGQLLEITGRNLMFRRMDVRGSGPDLDYMTWSKKRWNATSSGIRSRAADLLIENSRFTGTNFAISSTGPRARILNNTIHGFAGDGIRPIGDNSLVQGNLITDNVKVNQNHDDGIQSWSRGKHGRSGQGVQTGLTIDGNTIIEWTGRKDHPLHGPLQGIGLFDGLFNNLTITNNVIMVSAYHGIAVYGGKNARILNNTLVNPEKVSHEKPWIRLGPHKDGRPATGGIVANNIAPNFKISPGNRSVMNAHLIYPHRDLDYADNGILRLKSGSNLIGQADPDFSPERDHDGILREGQPNPGAFQNTGE